MPDQTATESTEAPLDTAADPSITSISLPRLDVYKESRPVKENLADRTAIALTGQVLCRTAKLRTRTLSKILEQVEPHTETLKAFSDDELRAQFASLAPRLRRDRSFPIAPVGHAFAIIREASDRVLGKRHFPVQMIGAYAMLKGMIAEMQTGEGKTLTATLAAATASLAGLKTHVVTVNDYLAARDAETLGPLYEFLGLSVGIVGQEQETEERQQGYNADITYCTNNILTFDYLRDQIELKHHINPVQLRLNKLYSGANQSSNQLLHGLHFAIIDEVDSILVDEARTPLLISQEVPLQFTQQDLEAALNLTRTLQENIDYQLIPEHRRAELTTEGEANLKTAAEQLQGKWLVPAWRRELIIKAISALKLFNRDEHYLLDDEGKVQIIDEYTGRIMPDRFWSDGLHQLIELKENCELSAGRSTMARISYQRFFRRYGLLSGMTGTANDVELELWRVYRLKVASIPTHRPVLRKDLGEKIYASREQKWQAIAQRSKELQQQGRAVLIGTRTVNDSLEASRFIKELGLDYQLLNASQDAEEADIIAQAGQYQRITIATNMAGRGTDIIPDEEVLKNGGLHVILSEMHESARIDKQLHGRCGRQGQPGSFEAMLSLEDSLLENYQGKLLPALIKKAPPWAQATAKSTLLKRAQRATENMHGKMRWQVLKSDDQLSDMLAFSGRAE